MTYAVEAIGQMLLNVSILGGGMLFAVIALILGIARGMTKNQDDWVLIFSAFAWLFSLMIPDAIWSGTVFLLGTIALTNAYMPVIKEINGSNIFVIAVMALILNSALLFGMGLQQTSLSWKTNQASVEADVRNIASNAFGLFTDHSIGADTVICPSDLNERQVVDCTPTPFDSFLDSGVFDPFIPIFTATGIIGKAIKLAGRTLLAPFVIAKAYSGFVASSFVAILMGVYVSMWNIVIMINVIKFILNKRGMN